MLAGEGYSCNTDTPVTTYGAKIQYLCRMVRGKALRHIDTFSDEVGSTTAEHLKSIILGLVTHFYPVNVLSKQNHNMRRGMRKYYGLKVRRYAVRMIYLDKYLDLLPREKASGKSSETDFFKHHA